MILEELKKFIKIPKGELRQTFEDAAMMDEEELAFLFKCVCLIGCTGHGKSSTGNSLINDNVFSVSAGPESETCQTEGALARWFGKQDEMPVLVIDSPGIGDSKNRDTKHIAEMVVRLKEIGYVHTFLIVFNYEEPRFSEALQDTIRLFCEIFDESFFQNSLLMFTRFKQDDRNNWQRQQGKKMDRNQVIEEFTKHFRDKFHFELDPSQFCFIENGIKENPEASDLEKVLFDSTVEYVKKFTERQKPFYCFDIKQVASGRDALKHQIEEIVELRKQELDQHRQQLDEKERQFRENHNELEKIQQQIVLKQRQIASLPPQGKKKKKLCIIF